MRMARLVGCVAGGALLLGWAGGCGNGSTQLSPADFSDASQAEASEGVSSVAAESHARATRQRAAGSGSPSQNPAEVAPQPTAEVTADDSTETEQAAEEAEPSQAGPQLGASSPDREPTTDTGGLSDSIMGEVELEEDAPPLTDDAAVEAAAEAAAEAAGEAAGEGLFVDAMVGQINGKPVYARSIFRSVGEDVLARLGETQSRLSFRREVEGLIFSEVQSRVVDALILAEAEKDLTEQQHHQLLAYMEQEREQILARHLGSEALAERALQEEYGHGLDRELEHRRQQALIDRYRHEKLLPQIVVTRRDVERYYRDNYDRYNQSATAEVRVMLITDERTADAVEAALAEGQAFAELDQRQSVVTGRGDVADFSQVRWDSVNEAVRELEVGEHTGRIEVEDGFVWAKLESVEGGASQGIKDVFLDIEERLRANRASQLQQRYIRDLLESGNFTPVEQMTRSLLEIALSRYAQPSN